MYVKKDIINQHFLQDFLNPQDNAPKTTLHYHPKTTNILALPVECK